MPQVKLVQIVVNLCKNSKHYSKSFKHIGTGDRTRTCTALTTRT